MSWMSYGLGVLTTPVLVFVVAMWSEWRQDREARRADRMAAAHRLECRPCHDGYVRDHAA